MPRTHCNKQKLRSRRNYEQFRNAIECMLQYRDPSYRHLKVINVKIQETIGQFYIFFQTRAEVGFSPWAKDKGKADTEKVR